jgi:hypothetical protein
MSVVLGDGPAVDTEVVMNQTTALREGVDKCRDTLGLAAWSLRWVDAEPKLRDARDALAGELSVYLGADMDEDTEVLHTAAHEALQLVLRALGAGIAAEVRGGNAQLEVRRLIAEAMATLDDTLESK